eukprot:2381604-Prymnesium_polylepis.2
MVPCRARGGGCATCAHRAAGAAAAPHLSRLSLGVPVEDGTPRGSGLGPLASRLNPARRLMITACLASGPRALRRGGGGF